MAIRFRCCNSACDRAMRAPDGTTGRQARCPACGTVQAIPEGDVLWPTLAPPGPSGTAQIDATDATNGTEPITCEDRGPPLPAHAAPEPPAGPADAADIGAFGVDCLKAITYGLSNFRSLIILVIYGVLALGFGRLFGLVLSRAAGARLVSLCFSLALYLIVGGMYLRLYLDCILSSLEGVDETPDTPPFNISELFVTGLRGFGILAVYVFPVVTIPLLPLGLLAWGYANDNRTYNVLWATRAARRRPVHLVVLWVVLILWCAAMCTAVSILSGVLTILIGRLERLGCVGILLLIPVFLGGFAVIAAIACTFLAATFRSIGMLGRHCEDLIEMLPDEADKTRTWCFIGAGVVASVLVLLLIDVAFGAESARPGPARSSDAKPVPFEGLPKPIPSRARTRPSGGVED